MVPKDTIKSLNQEETQVTYRAPVRHAAKAHSASQPDYGHDPTPLLAQCRPKLDSP